MIQFHQHFLFKFFFTIEEGKQKPESKFCEKPLSLPMVHWEVRILSENKLVLKCCRLKLCFDILNVIRTENLVDLIMLFVCRTFPCLASKVFLSFEQLLLSNI